MAKQHIFFILFVVAVNYMTVGSIAQPHNSLHIVGGAEGWTIPPNKTFYNKWAAKRNFRVGDKLMFLYHTSVYNVLQVSKEDYYDCTEKNVINRWFLGPTIVNMTEPGMHSYYDGIGLHCEKGQKLAINVTGPSVTSSGTHIAVSPKHFGLLGLFVYFVYSMLA